MPDIQINLGRHWLIIPFGSNMTDDDQTAINNQSATNQESFREWLEKCTVIKPILQ